MGRCLLGGRAGEWVGIYPPFIVVCVTRFNKIAISNNKFQMASGQGSHWLIESPTIFSSMYSPPLSDICQFYFLNIHNTSINTIIWQFAPFIYHPL